jgi:hypothetical protein
MTKKGALLRHVFVLLIALAQNACSGGSPPKPSPSPFTTGQSPSPGVLAQSSSIPATLQASPAASSTEPQPACPASATLDAGWSFVGSIIATHPNTEGYWALAGPESPEIQLSWAADRPFVSPQGDKVAFVAASPRPRLIVATFTGEEITSIDWAPEWGIRPDGWFNEEWLRLQRSEEAPTTVRLVSPWTGELLVLEPQLPNLDPYAASQYAAATYSPDMDLVIYMRLDAETYQGQFALWNLRQGRAIWNSESDTRQSHAMFTFPAWSPDGTMLAVTDSRPEDSQSGLRRQDLIVLTRDGQIAARTDFHNDFDEYWIGRDLLWSPDGNKIAFWILPLDGDSPRSYGLHLLHLDMNRLVNTCVKNDDIPGGAWSPDGGFLAAIASLAQQRSLVILNPAAGSSLTLSSVEPLELIGWAASP